MHPPPLRRVLPRSCRARRHRTSPVMINTSGCRSIDRELGNIRQAIAWSIQHQPGDRLADGRCARAGGATCGDATPTGGRWAASALRAGRTHRAACGRRSCSWPATLAFLQCDYAEAKPMVEQRARSLRGEPSDRAGLVWSIGTARLDRP